MSPLHNDFITALSDYDPERRAFLIEKLYSGHSANESMNITCQALWKDGYVIGRLSGRDFIAAHKDGVTVVIARMLATEEGWVLLS